MHYYSFHTQGAELGSMMPSHHGYIIWVFRGFEKDKFGHFLGFYNAIGCIIGMAKGIYIIHICPHLLA